MTVPKMDSGVAAASSYRFVGMLPSNRDRPGHAALYERRCADDALDLVAMTFVRREDASALLLQAQLCSHRWLKHGHVTRLVDVLLTPSHVCIATEYGSGGDMATLLRNTPNGRLDEQSARWYFQQLILALDYLHRPGAIKPPLFHHNLQLSSILLLTPAGSHLPQLKLSGFESANTERRQARPDDKAGRAAIYATPEALRGDECDGEAADLWAAGVILKLLLLGHGAVEDGGQHHCPDPLAPQLQMTQQAASSLSSPCLDLLGRLLAQEPSRRLPMSAVLQHPWFLTQLPEGVLQYNDQCLGITDYTDMPSQGQIRELLEKAKLGFSAPRHLVSPYKR